MGEWGILIIRGSRADIFRFAWRHGGEPKDKAGGEVEGRKAA